MSWSVGQQQTGVVYPDGPAARAEGRSAYRGHVRYRFEWNFAGDGGGEFDGNGGGDHGDQRQKWGSGEASRVDHLKPEEIAKMIEDAEMFQVQDEEKQGSLKKKSELETYLYKVNKILRKSEIKKSMPKEMRDALRGEIGDILDWIEENPEEKGEVYEKRMREFERKAELKIAPFRVFDGRSWGVG